MKFHYSLVLLFTFLVLPSFAQDSSPTRVACVGDSITEGFGIGNPGQDGYPAQLARLLGPKWNVMNFGASRNTLTKRGDISYWNNPRFAAAEAFAPQIVVIMLGTNDCIPLNQDKLKSDFVSDYKEMIQTFTKLDSHPKVWICTLAPVVPADYAKSHNLYVQSIDGEAVEKVALPMIAHVSAETLTPIIDVNAALAGHFDLFCDSVHPNPQGAKVIAQTVYGAIKDSAPKPSP